MAKPLTAYSTGGTSAGVQLNDLTVKLNSLTVFMSGQSSLTPNVISNKPRTAFTTPAKPDTAYTSVATLSWLLNSTIVKLNSTLYLLSGFTTANPNPNTLNSKPKTAYTPV